jgi:PAS domain S-box-containing protein
MAPLDVDMDLGLSQMEGEPQSAHPASGFPPFASQSQSQPQIPSEMAPNGASDAFALSAQDAGAMTGAGAGPLPTDFQSQIGPSTGSTLTEFTKRRNWTQRLLEEMRDFLHILTPDGRILYASPSCKELTGWDPAQLVGQYLSKFIHPEDHAIFNAEFHDSMNSGQPLRFFYRFRKIDDTFIIFESHGHPHLSKDTSLPFSATPTLNCRGFFMMSRPYPTKNAALLDSFLEHKIENERLMKRIAELKREEQEELENEDSQWRSRADTFSSIAPSETLGQTESEGQAAATAAYNAMPPPAKPPLSNTALTRQNLDQALAASKPDSINDKMARYEGTTHLETIEMLTGLRYRDGERSQGISTGDASPLLIRGDAGIQISLDRDARSSSDKKKKMKIADEYVCTDCGTLDSPEWRKGPNGPKTLCNACGRKSAHSR